jgi:predicted transcriptional regulator of viral defense system
MNRSRLQIAKPDIVAFFSERALHVLKTRQLGAILSEQRRGWRLAQNTTVDQFVAFLIKHADLKRYTFEFPQRPETLFVWGKVPLLEILGHLKTKSYFSHYTAMRLHGLTEQVPKRIYISHERTNEASNTGLSQAAIDEAFQRPARVSSNAIDFGDHRIVLINSAFTGELGVINQDARYGLEESVTVRVTNLERTLIDAAVRPVYSGGVYEVAKAFELAKDTVSVNSLSAMLKKLKFAYPYHQAIGFYLERADYRTSSIDLLRRFPIEFDFYLMHEMAQTRFDKTWRLYVPKGF